MLRQITKKHILALLGLIDKDLTFDVTLVSLGGTALTLLGNKEFSLDVDIIMGPAEKQAEFDEVYFKAIKQMKINPGEHPPFTAFDMSLLNITDFLQKADLVKNAKFKHITLYTLNLIDIVLSKNFRGLDKDIDDINDVLRTRKITKQDVQKRYLELLKQQDFDIRPKFIQKYAEFVTNFGALLK
jgi:hypothetical protein